MIVACCTEKLAKKYISSRTGRKNKDMNIIYFFKNSILIDLIIMMLG